jgi:hypothetical protein
VIAQDERSHRFHHRHGAWQHARVVSPARGELGWFMRRGHGFLFVRDGRGGLKCDPEINFFAVADAALHSAGEIRRCPDFAFAHFKRIVVLGTLHVRGGETGADLETFRRGQTQHRFGQIGFQFVKHRFSQSGRHAAHDAFDCAT